MLERKRIYILVKTYPTLSKEYSELVCTAGIQEDGSWIRLYPIPFRKLELDQQYPKYNWISVDVCKNTNDFRPETYRPYTDTIAIENKNVTNKKVNWDERREIVLRKTHVFKNMEELIQRAKTDKTSLAIFKPTKVLGFTAEETQREWDRDKLKYIKKLASQMSMLETPEQINKEFTVVQKIPYKFSYIFEDEQGKRSKLMIEDWETGMLYLNCLKTTNGNEKEAVQKVKDKYIGFVEKKDLYFFMGTTLSHHLRSKNPFIIIGTFTPPFETENRQLGMI